MKAGMLRRAADASRDETLRDVGIDRAKGLIATLGTDADNLFLILSAKTLNSNLQLSARVAEEELGTEDAPRRRRFRFRPVQQHRPSHGAGHCSGRTCSSSSISPRRAGT